MNRRVRLTARLGAAPACLFQPELGADVRKMATAILSPFQQGIERWAKLLSPVREAILHLWRNLVVDCSLDDAVSLQLTKLLREHLLRNCRNRAFEVGKAQNLAAE